jgi:hypothetical protein
VVGQQAEDGGGHHVDGRDFEMLKEDFGCFLAGCGSVQGGLGEEDGVLRGEAGGGGDATS